MEQKKVIAEFRLEDLLGIGFTVIILGIGLAYGMNVMGDIRDDIATCDSGFKYNTSNNMCYNVSYVSGDHVKVVSPVGADFNASIDGINAVAKIPAKLGLIVTVVIASVIIGILVTYLWVKFK